MFFFSRDLSDTELLGLLDVEGGPDWPTVGRVLTSLEGRGQRGPDGRPWIEIVRDRLEKAGHPKSLGHLRKMRRAYAFLRAELVTRGEDPDARPLDHVVLTALETAERIARLGAEAGRAALDACLSGASQAHLEALYAAARQEHAVQLTPRQLAWEARRESARTKRDGTAQRVAVEKSLLLEPAQWWGLPGGSAATIPAAALPPWLRSNDTLWVTATTATGEHRLGGAQIVQLGHGDARGWHRLLESVLFRASFVDRYWLLLEADVSEAERFRDWLAILRAPNLCFGLVPSDSGSDLCRLRMGEESPVPDRRGILLGALLRHGSRAPGPS